MFIFAKINYSAYANHIYTIRLYIQVLLRWPRTNSCRIVNLYEPYLLPYFHAFSVAYDSTGLSESMSSCILQSFSITSCVWTLKAVRPVGLGQTSLSFSWSDESDFLFCNRVRSWYTCWHEHSGKCYELTIFYKKRFCIVFLKPSCAFGLNCSISV